VLAAPQLVADVVRSGPIGHMAELIAAFLGDRERFGLVLVTTAEEMPVEETFELMAALDRRFGREPEAIIVNALYPPFDGGDDDPATALWRDRRAINDVQLARLLDNWAGPVAEVPLLAIDPGPALVGSIARIVQTQLRPAG